MRKYVFLIIFLTRFCSASLNLSCTTIKYLLCIIFCCRERVVTSCAFQKENNVLFLLLHIEKYLLCTIHLVIPKRVNCACKHNCITRSKNVGKSYGFHMACGGFLMGMFGQASCFVGASVFGVSSKRVGSRLCLWVFYGGCG